MPQLNPSPWLFLFILTWSTLLSAYLKKITSLNLSTKGIGKSDKAKMNTWLWPWP